MKSKITKIQILKKGMAIMMIAMFLTTPITYATTSLDDSYLEGSILDKLLYGTIGSTAKEIEEWLKENETLYIVNETQLRAFAEYVNNGNSCNDKKIVLLNDINLDSETEWIPIGSGISSNGDGISFKGIFDGNNKTIRGVKITKLGRSYSELTNVGLFGTVNGTVKNLITENFNINIEFNESDKDRYHSAGNIAGLCYNGTIENCINRSDIYAGNRVGGIVGSAVNSSIINCYNSANVSGYADIGGVIGCAHSVAISKTSNTGEINGYQNIGGIVGSVEASENAKSNIDYCANKAKIRGHFYVGGIVGYAEGAIDQKETVYLNITNCYAIDCIDTYNNDTNTYEIIGVRDVGGIVGGVINANISKCASTQDILVVDKCAGGIVGLAQKAHIDAAISTSRVETDYRHINQSVYVNEQNPVVTNLENVSSSIVGGIVGQAEDTVISKCCIGNRYRANDEVGGIAGVTSKTSISDDQKMIIISAEGAEQTIIENKSKKQEIIYLLEDGNVKINKPSEANFEIVGKNLTEDSVIEAKNYEIVTDTTTICGVSVRDSSSIGGSTTSDSGITMIIDGTSEKMGSPIGTDSAITQIIDENLTVIYEIYKNNDTNKIQGNEYFIAGDTIKVKTTYNKYLAMTNDPLEKINQAPTLKINNNIQMTAGTVNVDSSNYTTTIEYTYTVQDEDNFEIETLNWSKNGRIFAYNSDAHPEVLTSSKETNVNNITVDTKKPTVNTKVYVDNKLEPVVDKQERYTAGKEIKFEVTTNEQIKGDYTLPEIQVSFSESGIGKYNYIEESTKKEKSGFAKCIDSKINLDSGTTTWMYSYQIQEFDEGKLEFEFTAGEIEDLAGNVTDIQELYKPSASAPSKPVTGTDWGNDLGVTYEFYKNSVSETNKITSQTYLTGDDDLIVVATYDKVLYVLFGKINGENYSIPFSSEYKTYAPSIYLNKEANLKSGTVDSVDIINNNTNTKIQYTFRDIAKEYGIKTLTQISNISIKNDSNSGKTIGQVTLTGEIGYSENYYNEYTDESTENVKYLRDNAFTTTEELYDIIIDSVGVTNNITPYNIYADTTAPTVTITTDKSNPTNADEIVYTFKFSEEVKGFTADDITVNNGIKPTEKNGEGEEATDKAVFTEVVKEGWEYKLAVKPTITKGNEGIVQVIVEEGVCTDLVAINNVRQESNITIDKKAPILLGLEASVDNPKVDYYKTGDKVTIVATFTENIKGETVNGAEKLPTLALKFSESGNAKGSVSEPIKDGNKITYTYTIQAGDEGTLSVSGFSGKVIDVAGNETIVTKRTLDGDTIIADNIAPKLVGITAIAPNFEYEGLLKDGETIRYGEISKTRDKNTITIIAEYSENIYNLNSNQTTEITDTTAPVLTLKFGNTNAKGNVRFDKVEGNKIYYIYDITAGDNGQTAGDNGQLAIVSLNGTVSDIAGNIVTTNTSLPKLEEYAEESKLSDEEHIVVDTKKPEITFEVTAINYDDAKNEIKGNGTYYRKGSVITVVAEFDEYVYKNADKDLIRFTKENNNASTLNISFAEGETGVGTCTDVKYENGKTIFIYTYTVKENDNGQLSLNIAEETYDIALNGNNVKLEAKDIYADTIRPFYEDHPGIKYEGNGYKVEFNENLYYLDENNEVKSFGDIKYAPKLKFDAMDAEYQPSVSKNVITYSGEYINAKPYLGASRLCDIAGNLYAYFDQEAPKLERIEVTSPATRTYNAGEVITIVATFNEKLNEKSTAPKLELAFRDTEDKNAMGTVSTGVINGNTITYTYTITADDNQGKGDTGVLQLKSFAGTGLLDLSNNEWVEENTKTLTGHVITADTPAPTVTITSDVENTNNGIVTYTFTWSEKVNGFDKEDIEVINGSKANFKQIDTEGKVYTLIVDTIGEGRQIVKVVAEACEDIAGNLNSEREIYNGVVIDYTKPNIRAKVNGGKFVLATDNNKSELNEIIVVNEELSKFEYAWSTSEDINTITEWENKDISKIVVNSDINLSKEVSTANTTYYLYIKATDLAGNTVETRTKGFVVLDSKINFSGMPEEFTNEDVTINITYGEGLTENRKAGISGKTQSADTSKIIVSENGTVYAEATDKAGNKVYSTLEIDKIDKLAPEATIAYTTNEDGTVTATISFNEENVTVTNNSGKTDYTFTENGEFTFEFKDRVGNKGIAVAKVTTIVPKDEIAPTITFNYTLSNVTVGNPIGATIVTNEDAKISYSWDNKEWITSENYVRSVNGVQTPNQAGTYILYAKAEDRSGNTSEVQILEFTVVNKVEDIKTPEIIFEDLPVIQVNGIKYVKVSPNVTTEYLTNRMSKEALCGKTPEYTKLTKEGKLRTGSEIAINGSTKYIVVVKGDVNSDGDIDFIKDIIRANNYRLGIIDLSIPQILAADVNDNGKVEFIQDIIAINNYRLGLIKYL